MKRFVICVLMLTALCQVSFAGEINQAEVQRLGDTVQHIGGGHRDDGVDAFIEAMQPPASDDDKWFISVVSTQGCRPCAELKRAWRKKPLAFGSGRSGRSQDVLGPLLGIYDRGPEPVVAV